VFRACLVGSAIVFCLILIPVVHWVTAIPAPFIGGFVAGARRKGRLGEELLIGPVMALVLTGPILLVFLIVSLLFDFGAHFVLSGGLIYALYAAALGTLGAATGIRSSR
jgi:hypothetical protein